MSSIADVVAYDGESTPLAHTYKPIYVRNEDGKQVAFYREVISGVPLEALPTLEFSQEKLKSGITKLAARATLPVMESVNGANAAGYTAPPAVAYRVTMETTLWAPARSTRQERRNVRHLLTRAMLGVITSAGPYTSGPGSELFDDAISPT